MDWEFDILYAIQSIRTPFLDKVMAFLSTIGNAGALWIVIGVVLCISKKYRRGGMQMLSAELLSFIVGNLIIKNMVDRLRPCQIDETVSLIVKIPFDSSFPSGHTLNGISAAVTLMFRQKNGNTGDCTCGTYSVFAYVQLHAFPNGCPGRSSAWGGIGCVCELFV